MPASWRPCTPRCCSGACSPGSRCGMGRAPLTRRMGAAPAHLCGRAPPAPPPCAACARQTALPRPASCSTPTPLAAAGLTPGTSPPPSRTLRASFSPVAPMHSLVGAIFLIHIQPLSLLFRSLPTSHPPYFPTPLDLTYRTRLAGLQQGLPGPRADQLGLWGAHGALQGDLPWGLHQGLDESHRVAGLQLLDTHHHLEVRRGRGKIRYPVGARPHKTCS